MTGSRRLTLLLAMAGALAAAGPAHAAVTYTVTSTADTSSCPGPDVNGAGRGCTLRGAVDKVYDSSQDATIALQAQEYPIGSELSVGNVGQAGKVTIAGPATGIATIRGGGQSRLISNEASLTLRNLTLTGGKATDGTGGGAVLTAGDMTVEDSVLTGNAVVPASSTDGIGYGGGAIASSNIVTGSNPELIVRRTTISDNAVSTSEGLPYGGGIAYEGTRALTVEASTISGNSVSGGSGGTGGGVYVGQAASLAMTNSTVAGNSSDGGGGGAYSYTRSASTIAASTISSNTAPRGGGVYWESGPALKLTNSIVDNGAAGCGTLSATEIVDGGGNVDAGTSCGLAGGGRAPKLGTLATPTTGGPAVMVPTPASPAIDGGTALCPPEDARGVSRPLDGDGDGTQRCDAGAVEYVPGTSIATSASTTNATATVAVAGLAGDAPVTSASVGYGTSAGTYPLSSSVVPFAQNGVASVPLSGLAAATTYHYAAAVSDGVHTFRGTDLTLTTKADPDARTDVATDVTQTAATLRGTVDRKGLEGVTSRFEYGPTTTYGTSTPVEDVVDSPALARAVDGLMPGTTYHYRIVVTANGRSVAGDDATLTTAAAPVEPPPTATPGPVEDPIPSPAPALKATLTAPKRLSLHRAKGYGIAVACSKHCALKATLRVPAKVAKRLHRGRTLAATTGTGEASGKVRLTLRLSKALRTRLRTAKVHRAALVVVVTPDSGAPVRLRSTVIVRH